VKEDAMSDTQGTGSIVEAQLEGLRSDMEQIAAAASHDLRDPLREALNHCKALRQQPEFMGAQALEQLEQCIHSTLHNVQALRQFAYLVQNHESVQPVTFEGILQKAKLNNAQLLAQRNGHVSWQENLPIIRAKPKQLELLLTHVIENGLKHNDNPNPHVQITVNDTGQAYECIIQDNGNGIEPEFCTLVFGLFKRIQPDEGAGVGLAYAQKICLNHNGHIAMECETGQGCRVIVTLPHNLGAARYSAVGSGY
jgi:light-regulated signal transduction histidine kinase (bacteriophytochrome)